MKKLLIALLFLALVTPLHARNITEKDLFRFNWAADPEVSPDGSQALFVRVAADEKKDTYTTSIWIVATNGGAPRRLTNGPRDSAPRWSPDGKTIAFLRSIEKDGKPQPSQIYLLSLAGNEPRVLTSMPKAVESIAWSPNGRVIAFTATTKADDLDEKKDEKKKDEHQSDVRVVTEAIYRFNGAGYLDHSRATHIWTIDVPDLATEENPKPKQITSGDFSEADVAWTPDGARIFFTSDRVLESYYGNHDDDLYAVPSSGGDITKIVDAKVSVGAFAISPDGKEVAFVGRTDEPVRSYTEPDLFVASTTAGSTPRNLTTSFDRDIDSGPGGDQAPPRANRGPHPIWSSDGKSIIVTALEEGRSNLKRVDVASGNLSPITNANHAVQSFSIEGSTAVGGPTIVALISTPTRIGDLYRIAADGSTTRLTNVNEKLWSELTLTEPDDVWTTSFDGHKIETWVQKPPDFDPSKKYPLILNIHGGPHTAYGYTFDHEFQWMAAKGYVVVYPNPRGSTSYGEEFGNIIQYKYPGDDYKDLMAAVDAVIAKGYIDTKKLAVTGGSGGGLLTNWTITQTDRFVAAASQRDIADWADLWYTSDFTLFTPTWFRKAPFEDPQDFAARSPITYIERVHTPLMLIAGEADYRTPPTIGGEQMFRALKYLHRPVVMIRFPDESHELSRSGKPWHRVERLQHIVGWFDHWLLGVPKPEYEKGLRQ